MSYVGSVCLIQLFVSFISHLSTEAESRAHITHSSSLLLLQHTQYILHMPQHWWNSSQYYTASTKQDESYFLNAKNLGDAAQRGNVPTQPQHVGLTQEVMAGGWAGVSAGLGTPRTLCSNAGEYFINVEKSRRLSSRGPVVPQGTRMYNTYLYYENVLTEHPTGLSHPCPSSLPHTSPCALIFTSEMSPRCFCQSFNQNKILMSL